MPCKGGAAPGRHGGWAIIGAMSDGCRAAGPGPALLERLLAAHRPGFTLAREFPTEPGIYQLDLERIWRRGWLFAGHTCQVKRPGDYLVFDVDTDSIIVIRADDGGLRALHNTCRHRGMSLVAGPAGHVRLFVCPYHQWAYARDGALVACGGMDTEDGLDRQEFGLHRARAGGGRAGLRVPRRRPPALRRRRARLEPMLRPQGLERAKVAATRDYVVRANWKLVWENNRECWHCDVNHPQYVKANYDNAPIDDRRLARRSSRSPPRPRRASPATASPSTTERRAWCASRRPMAGGRSTARRSCRAG